MPAPPSLLYTRKEAAALEPAALQSLGAAGLLELIALDSAFAAFERSLFAAEPQRPRELLTSDGVTQGWAPQVY